MQISISTRHGQLSDASQEKIGSKVEKLARIFDRLTSIDVTIDLEHEDTPSVDLRVAAEHKHDFVATDRSTSLNARRVLRWAPSPNARGLHNQQSVESTHYWPVAP